MITSFKSYCETILRLAKKSKSRDVWIHSYGLFLGWIDGYNGPYELTYEEDNHSFLLLTGLIFLGKRVHLKIGVTNTDSRGKYCCPKCEAKALKRKRTFEINLGVAKELGCRVIVSEKDHSKGAAIGSKTCVIGGFNLTNSTFADMAVVFQDSKTNKKLRF